MKAERLERIGSVSDVDLRDVLLIAHDLGIRLVHERGPGPSILGGEIGYWTLMAPRRETGITLELATIFNEFDAIWEINEQVAEQLAREGCRGKVRAGGREIEYFHFRRLDPAESDGVMVMRDTVTGEVRYYSVPFSTRDLEIAVVEAAWKLAKRRVT